MTFNFHQLLAHAARTRRLGAGTILGSGTISNVDRSAGSSCLAERRTLEQIEHGAPHTPFLALRRHRAHRDEGRRRALHLRRHRADGFARIGYPLAPYPSTRLSNGRVHPLMARDGQEFRAWLSKPAGRAKGAVVVIQEIFGVNSHIRAVTDSFAAEGYLAIAPSLFDRVRMGIELGYTDKDMQEGRGYVDAAQAGPDVERHRGGHSYREARRPRGRGGLLLGRDAWPYLAACELPLACAVVVLRRRHHAASGQEAEVPGDVSLRRAGQAHHAG